MNGLFSTLAANIESERKRLKGKRLYEYINQQLGEMISSGQIPPGSTLPGISALAKELNVNYRTLKSAYEMLEHQGLINYRPNRKATVKGGKNSNSLSDKPVIGFIRMHCDAFCLDLSAGIRQYCEETGSDFLLTDAMFSHDNSLEALKNMSDEADGVILLPYERQDYTEGVKDFQKAGRHVVFVDRLLPGVEASTVTADNFSGAYLATKHLIEQHGRPVYHFGTVSEPSSCRERSNGWIRAMHDNNFLDVDKYLAGQDLSESNLAEMRTEHRKYNYKTAMDFLEAHRGEQLSVFASNDYKAESLYEAAEMMGMLVGRDIFIVGFGNLPICEKLPVKLSSIEQHTFEVGYNAARILGLMIDGSLRHRVNRVVPVDLIVRQSSLKV